MAVLLPSAFEHVEEPTNAGLADKATSAPGGKAHDRGSTRGGEQQEQPRHTSNETGA